MLRKKIGWCWRASFALALALLAPARPARAQSPKLDVLRFELSQPRSDSARVGLLCQMSENYWVLRTDSAAVYADKALALARRTGNRAGEGQALNRLGAALRERNLALALELFQRSLRLADELHDDALKAQNLRAMGILYVYLRDRRQSLGYYFEALRLARKLNDQHRIVLELNNIGLAYNVFNVLDSAAHYQRQALALAQKLGSSTNYIYYGLGNDARKGGRAAEARRCYHLSLRESEDLGHLRGVNLACVGLALLYQQTGPLDSSTHYARRGCAAARTNGFLRGVLNASQVLTQNFARTGGPPDSTLRYQTLLLAMKDTLFGQEKVMRLQDVDQKEKRLQTALVLARAELVGRYRSYALLATLLVLTAGTTLLVRHNRRQRRANADLARANNALAQSLDDLQTVQQQLVQQEKMAFLGELTAGIAHELQNPLAFVRNFADVSAGLVSEMAAASSPGGAAGQPALKQEIMAGLQQNLREISQHGQRATAIITGMLEHARTGTAERRETDLNALVAEGLRLAHQSFLVKEEGFAPVLLTDLAPGLPPVRLAAPDVLRVVINLCNNALYALRQHQRQQPDPAYRPTLTLRTRRRPGQVEVELSDNGPGIPERVRAQLFQPFFTTKPVGEGTGLGLSMSRDIIVNGHGGSLRLESEEGQGTTLRIVLPA